MKTFKYKDEVIPLAVNFSKLLTQCTGTQTITDGDVFVYDNKGEDQSTTMLVDKTLSSTRVDCTIQGGESGKIYNVEFSIKTQDYDFEEHIALEVR
jgi:hypothetical protein